MARRAARSPRPHRQTKATEFRVRVQNTEKAALIQAAKRAGLTLSAWVRQQCLRAAGVLPEGED